MLEHYADHKNKTANQVLQEWDVYGITQKKYDSYPRYHTERIENAYEYITVYLIPENTHSSTEIFSNAN